MSHITNSNSRLRVAAIATTAILKRVNGVELDPVDERVLVDRPGVRRALAQRLPIRLAGSPNVGGGDRRKRDKLDGVNLNLARADPVTATRLDPWLLPQPDRYRDVPAQDVVSQLTTELHGRESYRLGEDGFRCRCTQAADADDLIAGVYGRISANSSWPPSRAQPSAVPP
jgi:hypothetical protein